MIGTYLQMAIASLHGAKGRSMLTMLGVIVCVVSVVTVVGLGEGVKQQLVRQVEAGGSDLITVRGGNVEGFRDDGTVDANDLATVFSRIPLAERDAETLQAIDGVEYTVPLATVTGEVRVGDSQPIDDVTVIATTHNGAAAIGQDLVSGNFFGPNDSNASTAIIGERVAERMFQQNVPIGQSFELRGRKITVGGVFAPFDFNPLAPGLDYNNAIFIPYGTGSELAGTNLLPFQILVRPIDPGNVDALVATIRTELRETHNGQDDFSVLTAGDTIQLADSMIGLLTTLVSVMAGVALVIGGIGIMNVMLVSVSERTQEIGVRKSVGATSRQILSQFFAEAVVLSVIGALLGIVISLFVNYVVRITTELEPALDWRVMIGAAVVSVVVGSLFGLAPAAKAARKDPIQALRRF
jgi:ABC-type antimicrobial peptide transport system permease subunit